MSSVVSAQTLPLTKHHGLGNDFLVLLDVDGGHRGLDLARLAERVCDRRLGVGADGLLVATAGHEGADVTMVLHNADGGRAEMSGNGIRCFAQAVWDAGVATTGHELRVATDAGTRIVRRISRARSTKARSFT